MERHLYKANIDRLQKLVPPLNQIQSWATLRDRFNEELATTIDAVLLRDYFRAALHLIRDKNPQAASSAIQRLTLPVGVPSNATYHEIVAQFEQQLTYISNKVEETSAARVDLITRGLLAAINSGVLLPTAELLNDMEKAVKPLVEVAEREIKEINRNKRQELRNISDGM